MICRHFLSKMKKKNLPKKFIFGKIAVCKEQPAALIKSFFVGTFHWKTNKFCCISHGKDAVIVNVKHKFHLESR